MARAYLSLGANLGGREAALDRATRALAKNPRVKLLRRAPLFESDPVGFTEQPRFLNTVVEIDTDLSPAELLTAVKTLEHTMGRSSGSRWGPRLIDIDILLYDSESVATPTLTIPHSEMWSRAFVLVPLSELVPDLIGPAGVTIASAAGALLATQRVERYASATLPDQAPDHSDESGASRAAEKA